MVFMVLKPCALPTFFWLIIQFFIFYYFVKKKPMSNIKRDAETHEQYRSSSNVQKNLCTCLHVFFSTCQSPV